MRILLISESYWPNSDGGAQFERRLVQGLIGLGHTVFVWTPGVKFTSYVEADGASTIFREKSLPFLPNRRYHISYLPWTSARHVFGQARPDVVHLHNQGLIWYAGLSYARRHHIPVIGTNHFMPENWVMNAPLGALRPAVTRLLWSAIVAGFNRCNFVTAPTPTAIKLLTDHGLKTPHRAISNGVDTKLYRPRAVDHPTLLGRYHIPVERRVLYYAGRLEGEKRINVIIDALPLLVKDHDIHFVVTGAGVMRDRLLEQAKRLGLTERVTLTGFIEDDEKIDWYNTAEVFVMASIAELQSIVTLEAMGCGLPVVAADAAALSELCQPDINGYLFPPDDAPALAIAVDRILSNKTLAKKFGHASSQIIQRHHSTDVMFKTYEAAYRHVAREASI